jgi:hypothetical protein
MSPLGEYGFYMKFNNARASMQNNVSASHELRSSEGNAIRLSLVEMVAIGKNAAAQRESRIQRSGTIN